MTQTPAPKKKVVLAIYLAGRPELLALPAADEADALAQMTRIDERRGSSYAANDIDGAPLLLYPAHILFMRVE